MSDYPDGFPDGWEIAGWEDPSDGSWKNTEEGDPLPTVDDLADSYQIVVSHVEDGVTSYYSIMYGVDGWDGLEDAIYDIDEEYGG